MWGILSSCWWRHVEASIFSPSQAVELNILLIDLTLAVDEEVIEAPDTLWSEADELKVPCYLVAVVDNVQGVNLGEWWSTERVLNIHGATVLDLCAELEVEC